MVREIIKCTSLDLGKPSSDTRQLGPLLGQGIITSSGASWAHQRKTIAPELYMDKVKGGIADIKVDPHLSCFADDVIARACFGSNFSRNKEIFSRLGALQEVTSKALMSGNILGM
ncbi:hypothetical protein RJ640_016677, partial [Escallonia rubra]